MRTLEELEKCDFENLTFGELREYDLSCEDYCSFYGDGCSGGMMCYGGEPIEPPCCMYDDDAIIANEYCGMDSYRHYIEEEEHKKYVASQKRKQSRKEYNERNWTQLSHIKFIKKLIKKEQKRLRDIHDCRLFFESVNEVNAMFRETNSPCPEDVSTDRFSKKEQEIIDTIHNYELEIEDLKAIIKQNEKDFKKAKRAKEQNNE